MNNYEEIFNEIVNNLKNKNSLDISNVIKAYNFAKEKHKNQFRKSGEPYILHPVQVAYILEHLDFNTDVISSALLHDTVEDCGVTIKEIEKTFNKQIAEIVDAVTAITKENFMPDNENLFSNTDDFLKQAIEDKTYQKLISIGKNNKFGFYIKFADRLNNLQTIGIFPKYKKEAKVNETRKWIIPLAKLLKSKYFYDNIKNQCFLISTEEENKDFINYYNRYIKNMKNYLIILKEKIKREVGIYLNSLKANISLYKVIVEPKTQLEIYDSITSHFEISKLTKIKESNFISVPTYNIYIVFNEKEQTKNYMELLYEILNNTNLSQNLRAINISYDTFNNSYLVVKDNIRNLFGIACMSRAHFTEVQNGTITGTDVDMIDETMASGVVTNFITVLTPNKEKIKIPSHSTVLDFAFKLHNDIGFSCKYAFINDSPNKSPIYTRLNNGDKVEVVCEFDKNGLNVNIAELRWLAYCKNENTQRVLIKYFEKKYN